MYLLYNLYFRVSRYNTGFELPEDCKNMSFSELFDQELFSTHGKQFLNLNYFHKYNLCCKFSENKDCKLTIKIEKEKPLEPCYSAENSQDITDSHSLEKIEENVPSSSLSALTSKSFAPKRGINRTFIKSTKNCSVENLMFNSFCETKDLNIDQTIIEEPLVNDTVEEYGSMDVKSYYSTDDSQNTFESDGLAKFDDNVFSSLTKNCSHKYQGTNKTSAKTSANFDVEQNVFNSVGKTNGPSIVQTQLIVENIKHKPRVLNDAIEPVIKLKIKSYYSTDDDSQHTFESDDSVKFDGNVFSSLTKNNTQYHQGTIIIPTKTSVNFDVKQNMSNSVGKANDQTPQRLETAKHRPRDLVNDNIKQNICMEVKPSNSVHDSQKTFESLIKVENNSSSSLNKKNISKRRHIKKTPVNIDVGKTDDSITCQKSKKVKLSSLKKAPENLANDIIKQNICREIKSYNSIDDSQNTFGSNSLTKNCALKHQGINKISVKSENCSMNPFSKTEVSKIDPTKMKIKTHILKNAPNGVANDVKRSVVDMDVEVKKETNGIGLNDFCCADSNSKTPETGEVFVLKKKCLPPNETSLKNDRVDFPTCKNINEVTSETEKKKISWEEFRAKRGVVILSKNSGNNNINRIVILL